MGLPRASKIMFLNLGLLLMLVISGGIVITRNFGEFFLRDDNAVKPFAAYKLSAENLKFQPKSEDFELLRLDPQNIISQLRKEGYFLISTRKGNFEIELALHDLRSVDYSAEAISENNQARTVEANEMHTFKGTVRGVAGSHARFTIDEQTVQGIIWLDNEQFMIESAQNHLADARANEFVFFRVTDLLSQIALSCQFKPTVYNSSPTISNSTTATDVIAFRRVRVATEADYDFVLAEGGAAQANNEILSNLNMVEGVYERELGLTFNVVFQSAWETVDDPYSANDDLQLLNQLTSYWNANRANINRDLVHMWTNRPGSGGIAWFGVACNPIFPGYRYSLSGRVGLPRRYAYIAHEMAHQFGASHADKEPNCPGTIMAGSDGSPAQLTFCAFSRNEILTYINGFPLCLGLTGNKNFDFDADIRADISVYRNGIWYLQRSATGFAATQFGLTTDKITPADFDGDKKTDIAVFRPSNGIWYIFQSSNNAVVSTQFGIAEDLPRPADFDGDGKADICVFRPSSGNWYRLNSSNNQFVAVQFGAAGDIPQPADFDGDGKADINVFRPSNAVWYRLNSSDSSFTGVQFGAAGDVLTAADYDGDGKADISVFRPSNGTWYRLNSQNGQFSGVQWGANGDIPTAADYDGDGKADIAIFRNGNWYLLQSTAGFSAIQFGFATDKPIPAAFVQ